MRILFLANDDEGIYKFRKEVIEELLKNNEVFLSLYSGGYSEDYIGLLQKMGCKYIETKFNRQGTNPIDDLKLIKTYRKIIRDVEADVVLSYTIKPNVYGGIACQIENTPYIANITGLGSAIENGGLLQFISLFLYRIGLRKANKVFFQNTDNKDFMLQKKIVKNNQCELIPGSGVNLHDYKLLEYPNDEHINFVYIGRIMTEKGFKQYIDAAKYIKNKYPETIFNICGLYEDDYRSEVEQLHKNGTVVYHGSLSNMNEMYKKVQCVIHPTYYAEGMSNVLLEACACGRPCITTNRPGCKEIIEGGYNGFIVNQKDSEDLIRKIEEFISLPLSQRKQMGLNGRKKIEENFDRNIVIRKYVEEIKRIK